MRSMPRLPSLDHPRTHRLRKLAHIGRTLSRAGGVRALRLLAGGLGGTVIQVENTNYCNFHCTYCVTHSRHSTVKVQRGHMDLATFESVLDAHPRAVLCVIQGQGEPLLDPTLFEKIALARRRGLLTQIISNGSMLRPAMIDRLCREGPDIVLFSLDLVAPERLEAMRVGLRFGRVITGIAELTRARRGGRAMVIGLLSIMHGPFDPEVEASLLAFDCLDLDVILYKRLNPAYGERLSTYDPAETTPIPGAVARRLSYVLHHQDLKPVPPCSQLVHDAAYYLWDGQRTACCILNEPRYATPEFGREALLAAYAQRRMPSVCTQCSFFAGYPDRAAR